MAFAYAVQEYSIDISVGVAPSWWRHVAKAIVFCSPWAALAPGVQLIVRRAIHSAWSRWQIVLAWLAISGSATAIQSFMMAAFARLTMWPQLQVSPGRLSPFATEVANRMLGAGAINVLQIAVIALAYHALERNRERQARDLVESELHARLADAELASLRAQMQPHFLFNTLNTISALMRSDAERGQRVIARLGDLLRASLDRLREPQVSLNEELEFLHLYLDIQHARVGDRLTWDVNVHPDLRAALVPSLLLQPLVENAFRHGLEPRQGPGHVSVRVRRDVASLIIEIDDDGLGPGALPCNEGIGLKNTRQRLARLYENDWSLELRPGVERGTIVHVRLPLEMDERLIAGIQG